MRAPAPSQWSAVRGLPSAVHGVGAGLKQLPALSLQLVLPSGPPVQGFPACTTQLPPLHVSAPLQKVPSLHGAALLGWMQEPVALHLSSVHTLPSSVQGVLAGAKQLCAPSLQVALQSGPPAHGLPACTLQLPAPQVSAPSQKTPLS